MVHLPYVCNFPGGSERKESASNAGDRDSNPALGRSPEEGNGNPLQYCLENSHGQRSLWDPWDQKDLGMTERLTLMTFFSLSCIF